MGDGVIVDDVLIELKPDSFNRGDYVLSNIRAVETGKGSGSAALKKITDIADKHGVTISGDAVPLRQSMGEFSSKSSPAQLHRFYERHGFTFAQPARELPEGVEELLGIQESLTRRLDEMEGTDETESGI